MTGTGHELDPLHNPGDVDPDLCLLDDPADQPGGTALPESGAADASRSAMAEAMVAGYSTHTGIDNHEYHHDGHIESDHDHDHGHEDESLPHDYPALDLGRTTGGGEGSQQAGEDDGTLTGGGPAGAAGIEAGVNTALVPAAGIGVALGDTFRLHSLPGSGYSVFLDFDGHTTTGTAWSSYFKTASFHSSAFSLDGAGSFNEAELLHIQQIWQRVAEFFSPFNINVTTEDPGAAALTYSGSGDNAFGIRVVITDEGGKNWGGLAYNGSFDWGSDTAAFVYANSLGDSVHTIATAAAHETGHSLGLHHDGQGGSEYYHGHGSGTTSWAPAMGVGYYSSVIQWSKGDYAGATTTQDDLAVITTQNSGVTYAADDHGDSFGAATALGGTVTGGIASVQAFGVISGSGSRNDIDLFSFTLAAGGSIDLAVSGWSRAYVTGSDTPVYSKAALSMLDAKLTLYDASLAAIATSDDPARTDAAISLGNLAGGTYYLAVDGTGWGAPTGASPAGWSEYGSLGQYMVTGSYTLVAAPPPPPPPELVLDRSSLVTSESGGTDSVTLRALNATGDILVAVTGLDATEGSLSASSLLLNAANNWTATLGITGRDDREADGDATYELGFEADGLAARRLAVTNRDNDIAAADLGTAGIRSTGVAATPQASPLAFEDGRTMLLTEGLRITGHDYVLGWRWQFDGLAPGDYAVQLQARSSGEAMRIGYSVDGGANWRSFPEAVRKSAVFDGSFTATEVDGSLMVRLFDTERSGDTVQDSVTVDLLTIAPLLPPLALGASAADVLLA